MVIGSGDLSPTSSGFIKYILDENLEIVEIKKLGFVGYTVPKKKKPNIPEFRDIISYDENGYDFFNRTIMMTEHIFKFIKDCEYFIIEDYSYGSTASGHFTDIAEFCSQVKFQLLRQGTKLRLVSPTQIKQFATGKGNSEKPEMESAFLKLECQKIDINDLPEIPKYSRGKFVGLKHPKGISPRSDVIDAFFMCQLLYTELLIQKGIKQLRNLDPIEKHVLTHKTKNNKIPLTERDFIAWERK